MWILRTNKKGSIANTSKILLFIFIARYFTDFRKHRYGSSEKTNITGKIDATMGP